MTRAVLSLGSNQGDRVMHLQDAVARLGDELLVASGVYETEPWPTRRVGNHHSGTAGHGAGESGPAGRGADESGLAGSGPAAGTGAEAPSYLNAVVLVADAGTDPRHWLARARELERAAGRVRDPAHRYAPRTLDVDVITVWDAADQPVHSDDPELVLPHPRAHLRAFVLRPWIDIQPYASLPGHGLLTDLLRSEPVADDLPQVRPRPELKLESEP